ncbi:BON domain-containing protein [Sphingomonas sp. BN140010]|uniref:BON domain-containing protein n=1 Tax=Sphingomonas arvum TaxID=2992113 RepID=A0ABT3JE70_9SPHN|nr:BON domain-containing protein [Sphingomonas sp. BN140010]MCW3797209.1 BON domain-containing protein [Sphingomonas sp. BN140010]
MNDSDPQRVVREELEWEPSVDDAHIGVNARDGIVTLSGTVNTYAEKLAAERVAARVDGVKAIAQELEVRDAFMRPEGDDDVARRCTEALSWTVTLPKDRVKVRVEHGWVTLSGELEWNYQREEAFEVTRKLRGVKGVINNMTLKQRPTPSDFRERIKAALVRNAQIEANGIAIHTDGSKVTLTETVPRWSERYAAEYAAWAAPDVMDVDDRLTVI